MNYRKKTQKGYELNEPVLGESFCRGMNGTGISLASFCGRCISLRSTQSRVSA